MRLNRTTSPEQIQSYRLSWIPTTCIIIGPVLCGQTVFSSIVFYLMQQEAANALYEMKAIVMRCKGLCIKWA